MLVSLILAARLNAAPGPIKPVELEGLEMQCRGAGAHLSFWQGDAKAPSRSLAADAKGGEMLVVDVQNWTTSARAVPSLKPTQFAVRIVGGQGPSAKPQSAVLDCAAPNAQPLQMKTVAFPKPPAAQAHS